MKWTALIAVFCLQLSTFTCGLDAYAHHLDGNGATVAAGPQQPAPQQHGMDRPCEVHAAHVFADIAHAPAIARMRPTPAWPTAITVQFHSIPDPIEHPPTV